MNVELSFLAGLLLGTLNLYLMRETLERFLTGAPSHRSVAWASLLGLRMLLTVAALYAAVRAGAGIIGLAAGLVAAYTVFKLLQALRCASAAKACQR